MYKAKYGQEPQKVEVSEIKGYYQITVAINAVKLEEGWEADVNSFWELKSLINLDDVRSNPEDFINYVPVNSRQKIKDELTSSVQSYMDNTVKSRGYDNIQSACSYCTSTDPTFKNEGLTCISWRDKVWRTCYDILAEVEAGTRAIPTSEELIKELPKLEW